jgi:hypothetical protein
MAGLKSNNYKSVSIYDLRGRDFRENIPLGSISKISEKTGLSVSYVSRVVSGLNFNEDVVKQIVEIIKDSEQVQVPSSLVRVK